MDALADIHCASLPRDFLPRLGRQFLRRTFFPVVVGSSNSVTVVADVDDRPRSFVVFSVDGKSLSKELMRRWGHVGMALTGRAVRDPGLLKAGLDIIRGDKWELTIPVNDVESLPELYVIGTEPAYQSRGLGSAVIKAGLDTLRTLTRNTETPCLVKTSSEQARAMYRKNGWTDAGFARRGKRRFFVLIHK